MRTGSDFERAVRRGRRAGSPRVVVHSSTSGSDDAARVGFVVSKAVGGSVVRHRVARRLRETVRPHLADLPAGGLVVVRAQPAAARATFDELADDVTRLLGKVGVLARAASAPSGSAPSGAGSSGGAP